eukprot:scpid86507/ scgid33644/ 
MEGGKKVGVDIYVKTTTTLAIEDYTMNKPQQYVVFVSAASWWRDAKKYKCTLGACPVEKIEKVGATLREMKEGDGEAYIIPDAELAKLAEGFAEKWNTSTASAEEDDDETAKELFDDGNCVLRSLLHCVALKGLCPARHLERVARDDRLKVTVIWRLARNIALERRADLLVATQVLLSDHVLADDGAFLPHYLERIFESWASVGLMMGGWASSSYPSAISLCCVSRLSS